MKITHYDMFWISHQIKPSGDWLKWEQQNDFLRGQLQALVLLSVSHRVYSFVLYYKDGGFLWNIFPLLPSFPFFCLNRKEWGLNLGLAKKVINVLFSFIMVYSLVCVLLQAGLAKLIGLAGETNVQACSSKLYCGFM